MPRFLSMSSLQSTLKYSGGWEEHLVTVEPVDIYGPFSRVPDF